jgi:FAD/FMN-containing dehydrogenase
MLMSLMKIKSGGHTTNPGFSSTSGVQIAMYSFSDVVYDADANTVTVGTGLTFDDVYTALEKYGVTVVGAKATGLGVGGVTLGGGMVSINGFRDFIKLIHLLGYSFLANQYGLAVDNVVAYELVLPNGTVTNITSSTNSDLFFGLRVSSQWFVEFVYCLTFT